MKPLLFLKTQNIKLWSGLKANFLLFIVVAGWTLHFGAPAHNLVSSNNAFNLTGNKKWWSPQLFKSWTATFQAYWCDQWKWSSRHEDIVYRLAERSSNEDACILLVCLAKSLNSRTTAEQNHQRQLPLQLVKSRPQLSWQPCNWHTSYNQNSLDG